VVRDVAHDLGALVSAAGALPDPIAVLLERRDGIAVAHGTHPQRRGSRIRSTAPDPGIEPAADLHVRATTGD
jgi:hypothetical protein